jgi:hypothetical protein
MKSYFFIVLLFCVFGCSNSKKDEVKETKQQLYEQSEMAALMLQMYAVNLENKSRALQGNKPLEMPEEFLNIHSAKLTDPSDRTASFKSYSDFYLATYQQNDDLSKDSLIINHNKTVNSCIACHKTTCIGPIPKIKKLLIQY